MTILDGLPSLPTMVMPIYKATIQLSLEEVPMHANPKVLVEVDDNSALIVCDQQGILE
jgi:hypothetical protein